MSRLLDTNVLIAAQRGFPGIVREHLAAASPEELFVSAVSIAELWYGAARHPEPERKRSLWSRFLAPFPVLSFDRSAAERHAEVRHALRRSPIGERDLLIASIALANDLVVVTANTREFERVPGLEVEDWTG